MPSDPPTCGCALQVLGARDPARTPLWKKLVASAAAGVIGSAVANPTDVVMIRMQAQRVELPHSQPVHPPRQYKSTWGAFRQTAKEEGFRGLYRGVGPTMQRAGLLTAAQVIGLFASLDSLVWLTDSNVRYFLCRRDLEGPGERTALVSSDYKLLTCSELWFSFLLKSASTRRDERDRGSRVSESKTDVPELCCVTWL